MTALLGALGLFLVSSGASLVVASTADASTGGHIPVAVCHRDDGKGGGGNPAKDGYRLIVVDAGSTGGMNQLTGKNGHLTHRNDPNVFWKAASLPAGGAGWFNGTLVHVGDPKPDFISDFTDSNGVFHKLDGSFAHVEALCLAPVLAPADAAVNFTPGGCDPVTAANFTVGSPSDHVTYALTSVVDGTGANAGKVQLTVTATADPGYGLPPSGGPTQTFVSGWLASGKNCPGPTPETPVVNVVQGQCTPDGGVAGDSFSLPPNGNGVTYTSTPAAGPVAAGTQIVITATADASHVLNAVLGWVLSGTGANNSATYTYTFPTAQQAGCTTHTGNKVPTVEPTFTDPSCSNLDGSAIDLGGKGALSPAALNSKGGKLDTGLVTYTVTGTFAPGGTVNVVASPDAGYVLASGAVSSWQHTFADPTNCSHGNPKPPVNIESGMITTAMVPGHDHAAMRAWGIGMSIAGGAVVAGAFLFGRRRQTA